MTIKSNYVLRQMSRAAAWVGLNTLGGDLSEDYVQNKYNFVFAKKRESNLPRRDDINGRMRTVKK